MNKMKSIAAMLLLAGSMSFVACDKEEDPAPTPTPTPTLYERLGGIAAISAVTDQFLTNVATDSRINGQFADAVANEYRLTLLRNNLIDQICAGSGGPCQYKGKTMLEAHTGMGITEADFNALVEDLVASLNQFNVPEKEKNDLLAILGPMSSDIVGK